MPLLFLPIYRYRTKNFIKYYIKNIDKYYINRFGEKIYDNTFKYLELSQIDTDKQESISISNHAIKNQNTVMWYFINDILSKFHTTKIISRK